MYNTSIYIYIFFFYCTLIILADDNYVISINNGYTPLGRRLPTGSSSYKPYTDTYTDSFSYDIIRHTVDQIQDRIHIQPIRKLSIWSADLKNDTKEHQ